MLYAIRGSTFQTGNAPDRQVRWFEFADWLNVNRLRRAASEFGFLARQFLDFLRARDMTLTQVGKYHARGAPRLAEHAEHARARRRGLQSLDQKRRGRNRLAYISTDEVLDRRRIRGPGESLVRHTLPDRPRSGGSLGLGRVDEENGYPAATGGGDGVELDSETSISSRARRSSQMQWLEELLRECLTTARSIETPDQPPIPEEPEEELTACVSPRCKAAATTTSTSIASASRCRTIPPGLSRAISDRHFGVGGDGLILICPSDKADARMRMFNADGSEAEMCGNGIRCVAKYVYDHGLVRKSPLTIETGRGVLTLELEVAGGTVRQVRVDMGEPILQAARIPTTLPGDPPHRGRRSTSAARRCASPACRWAIRTASPSWTRSPISTVLGVGPADRDVIPPFRAASTSSSSSVNRPDDVTMRVWERGSGETLACGTGACAVAVAGVLTGRTQRRITAHLPGGDLQLDWSETDNHVYMTGPAVEVFSGEWPG